MSDPERRAAAVPSAPAFGRIGSLDGLRGVAALVVLVHHALLVEPSLADAYLPGGGGELTTTAQLMSFTPLHIFWAGSEAVWIFFVLSGFVLTLPYLHNRGAPWSVYYPRRFLRIYLPLWGALVVAAAMAWLIERDGSGNWWLASHEAFGDLGLGRIAADVILFPEPGSLTSVLWSLKWEIVFSALLPVVVLVAPLAKRVPFAVSAAALLAVIALGSRTASPALSFLPMFGLGALVATHAETIAHRCRRLTNAHWVALIVAAWMLLLAPWLIRSDLAGASPIGSLPLGPALLPLSVLGAVLIVIASWQCAFMQRWLMHPGVMWLGIRSFSLYLVHEPIVVSVGLVVNGFGPLFLPLALGLSVVAAAAFHRWVESPATKLSRRIRVGP